MLRKFVYILVKYYFRPPYKKSLVSYVSSLCEGDWEVLDFGCNDGDISAEIHSNVPTMKLLGVDIENDGHCKIQRTFYDGHTLPFSDNQFDCVFILDVLHHTDKIEHLLKEATRVSSKYLIIKDHHISNIFQKLFIGFGDFWGNFPFKIKCEYNYPHIDYWHQCFERLNLKVVDKIENQDYGFGVKDSTNFLYKLEKIRA